MQKEILYSNLYHELLAFDPSIIYIAVGCVMGGEPTPAINQQNPIFMEKYAGQKKFYIFYDPRIETPLTLESQIKLDTKFEKDTLRILENDEYFVISIKDYFHGYNFLSESFNDVGNEDVTFLLELITYVIENNKKMIVQDFTGNNITLAYDKLFTIFPKQNLLKQVLFDVTEEEGSCYVDFSMHPICYDAENNFIQPRYSTLTEIKKSKNPGFRKITKQRMDIITNYLAYYLRFLRGEEINVYNYNADFIKNNLEKLQIIYNNSIELTDENLSFVILLVFIDIIQSTEQSEDLITTLINDNCNRDKLRVLLNPIRNLLN